jgi:hypothetical protein
MFNSLSFKENVTCTDILVDITMFLLCFVEKTFFKEC